MKSVEELNVFKLAHKLTLEVYSSVKSFPEVERFGLVTQLCRAASSINANLLEGSSRISRKEYRQFVGIARGSAGELKYHLLLAKDLAYISAEKYEALLCEVNDISKMLTGLIKTLSKDS
ncbi:MAG TPA: four helix bundle protein [Candidatus Omnitrophota bacterium]|nr:four helix bundle protein [Candidatus Omnitrophota bacterium]HSA31819.1 four helix bundle protein [Candidatus Omnitrophota bacterium]